MRVMSITTRFPNPSRRWLIWQRADELVVQIDKVTKRFPAAERSGLGLRMRRASLSIPVNILAGSLRSAKGEKRRFYETAKRSLAELDACVDVGHARLRYITREHVQQIAVLRHDVDRLLNVLVHFVP